MMKIILAILINGLLIYFVAWLLPMVAIDNYLTAILAGIILGLANSFIKPILTILTLPLTIITFGLFLLVINGLMVMLTDAILGGFYVENFLWAIVFSLLLTLVNMLIGYRGETF